MKRKLCVLMILFLSFFVCLDRVDAIAMWMQCTDDVNEKMEGRQKEYNIYNTYAVIGNLSSGDNSGIRHLIYNGSNFYGGFGPVFLRYTNDTTYGTGKICWFNSYTTKVTDCKGSDKIDISELLQGYCPVGNVESSHTGATKGDFLTIYGKKRPSEVEYLNEPIFVIYEYKVKGGKDTYIMIEGYDTDGKYAFATDHKDNDEFKTNMAYKYNDDNNDLLTNDTADFGFMNWTMTTQARRVKNLGRNYFKLLDYNESWLVGGISGQKFEITGKKIYKSNDTSDVGFGLWAKNWYNSYAVELEELEVILQKFNEGGEYFKLIETSTEISNQIDKGKKYSFNNEYYSPQTMIEDLKNAYHDLDKILGNESLSFVTYDENCKETAEKSSDPKGAIFTSFTCDFFGKNKISKLTTGKQQKILDTMVLSVLSEKIDEISGSDLGIDKFQERAKEYLKLLAKSIGYVENNVFFDAELKEIVENLSDDYQGLLNQKFGSQIVVDCESLIDSELLAKVNYYLDIIKIAIPIILLGLGIADFTKAVFAGDEDKMKKAQMTFIKRAGVSVLIFFVPTIVRVLLTLANMVWNFIEPGSCGLFEI